MKTEKKIERTVVTKHDDRGRILEYERHAIEADSGTEKPILTAAQLAKPLRTGDLPNLMKAIAPAIGEFVAAAVAPLRARILELEKGGIKYCGVHQRALDYKRGSLVTHEGSAWCALVDTRDVPGKSDAWQLAVKAGRDGR